MMVIADVIYALRQFRRRPGAPLVIVLSLGAAMGLSTSLFTVVNALWFTPWPVPRVEEVRVVGVEATAAEWPNWPRRTPAFDGLAAVGSNGVARLGRMLVRPAFVSSNYFAVLGIPMAAGPGFDDRAPARAVVISHQFWQRRLAGDPNIIGRQLTLDRIGFERIEVPVTVVGVAAAGFKGTEMIVGAEMWMTLATAPQFGIEPERRVMVFGRLAAGVSDRQAEAELSVLNQRYGQVPRVRPTTVRVSTTDHYSLSPPSAATRARWTSFIVGIVFITLIACANVANLLLARGYARRAEIATRLAIGGRRGLIVRQLLIESLILSAAAGGIGMAVAARLPAALLGPLIDDLLGGQLTFAVDVRVFLWSLAVSLIACVGFGLVPALRATDLTLSEAIKEGHDNSKRALMPSLLGYQTIVSVMAIVIAGLMLRSAPVAKARQISHTVDGLSVVRLDPPRGLGPIERRTLVDALSQRLDAIAGGSGVAGMQEDEIRPAGVQTLRVTPEFFQVVGLPRIAGRPLEAIEPAGEVMVVNEAFARLFWPGRTALGQTLRTDDSRVRDRSLAGRRVVGVVENTLLSNPTAYLPAVPADVRVLFVRGPHDLITRETVAVVRVFGPAVAAEIITGSSWVAPLIGPSLLAAGMTAGSGAVALVLGIVGFFSLLEYSVQQRTREIGIRRALGARPRDVVRSIVAPAAGPLGRGLLIGSIGAGIAAAFMQRAQLPSGINPVDLLTYLAVAGILAVSAIAASFLPARRALRIEPAVALRAE